jgi:carbon monoxide dehydrogenase subunit G
MDMNGERRIALPRALVWQALNDADVLGQCIPGCQKIDKTSDTGFTASVVIKVGPVKATFSGAVELVDIVPETSYALNGQGTGGVAGFAKGGAKVALADDGEGTLLSYTVAANVGGKLAQIGGRLIDSTAVKLADQFFDNFGRVVAEKNGLAPAV